MLFNVNVLDLDLDDVTRLEEVETNGNPMPFQELAGDFEEVVTAEVLPFDDDDMEYVDEGDDLPF